MKALKEWMNKKNIPITSLAIYLEVDRSTVYRYFDGSRRPGASTIIDMSNFTGGEVTVEEIVRGLAE